MGKLLDAFGKLTYRNEDEVSQNFILPLLRDFLGYDLREIIPEQYFPARNLYSGVKVIPGGSKALNHRPDYVVCLNGSLNDPKFTIDSKGPTEDISDHLGQLRSYTLSVGQNLLMITNGIELRVYDVNHLLFHARNMEELQLQFSYLFRLLGRENQAVKSAAEIIKDYDFDAAIGQTAQAAMDRKLQQKKLLLSDFQGYLRNLSNDLENWHLPSRHFEALNNLELSKIDPNQLLTFRKHAIDTGSVRKEDTVTLPEIERDRSLNSKIFVGETGSGKSCLLKYLTYRSAQQCLQYREARIPVFVSLREMGPGYTLESLIVMGLNRYGYGCSSFHDLPNANDFVFFLDAYDEIREEFLQDTISAVDRLSAKYECYLTTRPSRPAPFKTSAVYLLLPISEDQVEILVREHTDNRYYEFKRQLDKNDLTKEAGNMLLLLCLISIFKESNSLPATITRVIRAVVDRIKNWQDSKNRSNSRLSWKAAQAFLAVLAYHIIEAGETSLQGDEAEPLVRGKMVEMESARSIPGGLTVGDVLQELAGTGLLIVNPDHSYFWHRLFLHYFAAFELERIYRNDERLMEKLALDPKWQVIVVGLASLLPEVTQLLRQLKGNIRLSAYCLAENCMAEAPEVRAVVEGLITQLRSLVSEVRIRAMNFLAAIHHEEAKEFLLGATEGDYPPDVRMLALRAICRTRSAEVRAILYRHLTWEEPNFLLGPSSQACVARGLFYYGEEEHLEIIRLWERTTDYLMSEECKNIFIELHSQGFLTAPLLKALREFYLKILHGAPQSREKAQALASVLSYAPHEGFAAEVVELIVRTGDVHNVDSVYDLTKHYRSAVLIELVKQKVLAGGDHDFLAEQLVDIVVDSPFEVPKETFYELTEHADPNIASKAIGALKRFSYPLVKDRVESHLYGKHPQLQAAALGVLVNNSEIVELLRSGRFPSPLFSPAAHTLLRAVRLYRLGEALPIMERVFNAIAERKLYDVEIHLALDLAGTYYFIGEADRHATILGWFFDGANFLQKDGHIHVNLMQELKYFDPELASQIAICYFRTYFPFRDEQALYQAQVFLEAVEALGQHGLVLYVKQMVEQALSDVKAGKAEARFHLERPMRTLAGLALQVDEEWLLTQLDEVRQGEGFDWAGLRRAAECLAHAGSAKALPYLKQMAVQHQHNPILLSVCQFAYEQICYREGMASSVDVLQAESGEG